MQLHLEGTRDESITSHSYGHTFSLSVFLISTEPYSCYGGTTVLRYLNDLAMPSEQHHRPLAGRVCSQANVVPKVHSPFSPSRQPTERHLPPLPGAPAGAGSAELFSEPQQNAAHPPASCRCSPCTAGLFSKHWDLQAVLAQDRPTPLVPSSCPVG